MVLKSYSKINLTLNVNKKLKSGLHDIQSYYCLINLSDKIKITKNKTNKDKIVFKGRFGNYVSTSSNSITHLLKILRGSKLITNHYSVVITKNIPVFSGLGGGTSNAAAIFNFLVKGGLKKKKIIKKVSKKIGSDFILFFKNQGFLQNLKSIKVVKKHNLFVLLSRPNVNCSTREIYSKVRKFTKKTTFDTQIINSKKKFIKYIIKNKNDLQTIVQKNHPITRKILNFISALEGCYLSRVSGSGSVCYGLFNNEKNVKKALKKLKRNYPKFWFSIAKTV